MIWTELIPAVVSLECAIKFIGRKSEQSYTNDYTMTWQANVKYK